MRNFIYKNRTEAGRILSDELKDYSDLTNVLVLGLPRGGVPVAAEVAKRLHADLDVIVARKLGVPGHEEVAMGAIATGGVEVINADVVRSFGVPDSAIEKIRRIENKELLRRERAYRGDRPPYNVQSRNVIIVDDGIATGATMKAAVTALRQLNPERIIAAAPVAPSDVFSTMSKAADKFICPVIPIYFRSVGEWYHNFSQTTDVEVKEILNRAWNKRPHKRELLAPSFLNFQADDLT